MRFLSQDAKIPLSSAMSQVKDLQKADLDSPDKIARVKASDMQAYFPDEKVAKQIVTAAKRVAKKRTAGDDSAPSPKKKRRNESLFSDAGPSPAELEASLELPASTIDEDEISKTVLFSNRAPLALAFVFTLLKYTMPEQPLSSRLSLAQGYIGVTSRARAIYLGIEGGKSADEEGYGEGHSKVTITGKEITVLKRWGYEWRTDQSLEQGSTQDTLQAEIQDENGPVPSGGETGENSAEPATEQQPPLWALDLEALKKSEKLGHAIASGQAHSGNNSTLPIHTPQSARAYLLKAFDTAPAADVKDAEKQKKSSATVKAAEKARNLGFLLRALDMLYDSWAVTLSPEELDKRTWSWYVRVRPSVEDGAAGWGGKNSLKLADILAMRRGA